MSIKMDGATPLSGKTLCVSCKHATVVRGQNCEEIIICNEAFYRNGGNPVPFKVASCTAYRDKNHPEKHEMESIAWIVQARKRGQPGFQQGPSELEFSIIPPKDDNEPR